MCFDEVSDCGCYLMIGVVEYGFVDKVCNLVLICESDLFGECVVCCCQDFCCIINFDILICNFVELYIGQLVVYLEYGVGCYVGMIMLEVGGIIGEYLMFIYVNDVKLYVLVLLLYLISCYVGGVEENVLLYKFGGDVWLCVWQKVVEKVCDVVVELLDIYV